MTSVVSCPWPSVILSEAKNRRGSSWVEEITGTAEILRCAQDDKCLMVMDQGQSNFSNGPLTTDHEQNRTEIQDL